MSILRKNRKRLAEAGWRVGTAAELLGLSAAHERFVEIKLRLVDAVRRQRSKLGLTQTQLGERMQSSQSRVAKLEAGDRTVSIDLLVHALLCMGVTRQQLGRMLGSSAA